MGKISYFSVLYLLLIKKLSLIKDSDDICKWIIIQHMDFNKNISVVVSVFNEEAVVASFWNELKRVIKQLSEKGLGFEVIFVNDGSTDNTPEILDGIASGTPGTKVVHFSKNFGHEAAMLAGIENATGDAIICMDADLQHPPSTIPSMTECFAEGAEVITMIRDQRSKSGWVKKIASSLFYRTINMLSKGDFEPMASDFFLISKRVAEIIVNNYREKTRFLRGLIQSVGFEKRSLSYTAPKRVAGKSKYSFMRLFLLSLSAIATFSHMPLRLGLGLGVMFGAFSLIVGIYSVIMKFAGQPFSGYTTIVLLMSLGFAMLFTVIGIIGEYIGYIFTEVKNRPVYIIERITG